MTSTPEVSYSRLPMVGRFYASVGSKTGLPDLRDLVRGSVWVLGLVVGLGGAARADITHIVQRGHTIDAIAKRYHVTVKAIEAANHLKDSHLKPGQELIIPGVDAPAAKHKGGASKPLASSHSTSPSPVKSAVDPMPPEPHGREEGETIHATRLGEDFRIKLRGAHGRISTTALRAFERLMRQGSATHSPDPRLVSLVGIVSSHFGGRTLEVVSGYRPYSPTQYTPHSNHNFGKALDFRIRGVSNELLRDFCRTLRNAGCGYYPNSTFVHMDVRDTKAFWTDWSRAGEPPKYDKPGVSADEGMSDVPEEREPTADDAASKERETESDASTGRESPGLPR
jgi:uncharacterized protein YcbK (DUF882 family)